MASKVDRQTCIDALQLWLDMGWPAHRLHEKAKALWGLNAHQTDLLLNECRQQSVAALSIDRQEFLAQQMTRLEALAVKAQDEGQLGVALNAFKEMHLLIGLHAQR